MPTTAKSAKKQKKSSVKPKAKAKIKPKPKVKKTGTLKKVAATKKIVTKKAARKKAAVHKTPSVKTRRSKPVKKVARRKSQIRELDVRPPGRRASRSGLLAGDLQGLSTRESADSESVAELLEEGNTFEAEAIAGVEAADAEEQEVETHETTEDDVPDEYLNDR
jgi:hypothetical protein